MLSENRPHVGQAADMETGRATMISASAADSMRSMINPQGASEIPWAMTAVPFRFAAEDPLRMHQF